MTEILDRSTGNTKYYSLNPKAAVIAAHAQKIGDFSWWEYDTRYSSLVVETAHCYHCGDMSAMKG